MEVKIEQSWKEQLADEFEKDYFKQLTDFVRQEYRQTTIYPPGPLIFNAFEHCPFDKVKVVILGQDPYHEPGQAHGLCFSVQDGVQFPPSLVNIFKEIHDDLGKPMPTDGNLIRWADQGVLLLNATLTVRAHQAGSHQNKGGPSITPVRLSGFLRQQAFQQNKRLPDRDRSGTDRLVTEWPGINTSPGHHDSCSACHISGLSARTS